MKLTDEQQSVVDMVASATPPRVATLTGGPGTGKTTTVRAIVAALASRGRSIALCAPSGKAAKRLSECSGREATTVHRLLGLRPDTWTPTPIQAAVVIVDEASMLSIRLLASLCRASFGGGGCVQTLLLVGDPEQLPPVGPGSPFLDLVAAATCPGVHLSEPQRAALDSGVVRAAYAIHAGKPPEWGPDFQLVETPDAELVAPTVWDFMQGIEREHGAGTVQVLSPQRTRAAGCDELNSYMDRAAWDLTCPYMVTGGAEPLAIDVGERYKEALVREFRPGSRVIHTKNNKVLGVFNGETGTVLEARRGFKASGKPSPRADELLVELDDGRLIDYKGAALGQLKLAWALTVHKYQGSELDNIVAVVHPSHSYMLTRSLLYVAVTRARKRVWVVGTQAAVDRAVSITKDLARETNLAHMLAPAEAVA